MPPQSRRPAAGASSVAKRRSRLDLPLPFGPVSSNASPAAMRQSTPAKTNRSPRRQARFSPISSAVSEKGGNPSGLKKGNYILDSLNPAPYQGEGVGGPFDPT